MTPEEKEAARDAIRAQIGVVQGEIERLTQATVAAGNDEGTAAEIAGHIRTLHRLMDELEAI